MISDQSNNSGSSVVDYESSHHITSDSQKFSMHFKYGGPDDEFIGDGNRISISHIGSTTQYTLDYVMFALSITKNILYVSQ